MGQAKKQMIEEMENGFSSVGDCFVCRRCIKDAGLRVLFAFKQRPGSCSFCSNAVSVCSMDDIIEHVIQSLHLEYGDPANEGLPYETREGGWQGQVYDLYELLDEVGLDCPEEIMQIILQSIHDYGWCKRDPYSLTADRTLAYGWKGFCEFIIHTARFVFYKAQNPAYDRDQHDEMNPVDILEALGRIVQRLALVETLPVGQTIYRVRVVDKNTMLSSASDLGAPPHEFATMPNRMSPVGIPMFYGAFDVETAIRETYEPGKGDSRKAVCGEFSTVRSLTVIDLTESFVVPSLFDLVEQRNRPYYRFMRDFIKDFMKPIERGDRAHADYVPTQVVTEYFRHVYRTDKGESIDGMIYPSSKTGQKAIVIFADAKGAIDLGGQVTASTLLQLIKAVDFDLAAYDAAPGAEELC